MSLNQDAIEFGRHVRAGEWRLGLLVARNVLPDKGHGNRNDAAASNRAKVSGRDFAKQAGVSQDTVRRYYKAWQAAAEAGIVPDATGLKPGQDVDLNVESLPAWSKYYAASRTDSRVSEREVKAALRKNPKLVTEAVQEDSEVARSAIGGLKARADKRAASVPDANLTPQERTRKKKEYEALQDQVSDVIDRAFGPAEVQGIVEGLGELANDLKGVAKAYGSKGIPAKYIRQIEEALAGFQEELNVAKMAASQGSK